MHRLKPRLAAGVLAMAHGVLSGDAHAAEMDIKPERLRGPSGEGDAAFRNVMGELGAVLAPSVVSPAATLGSAGMSLSIESAFTKIHSEGVTRDSAHTPYWEQAIRGSSPTSFLQLHSLKARKGLPFGFEATGTVGYLVETSLTAIGGELRWALIEGFYKGWLGAIPDVSIGLGARAATGSSEFSISSSAIDTKLSKTFVVGKSLWVSPYAAYQRVFTSAEAMGFQAVRLHRHRALAGGACRYDTLVAAAQLWTDVVPSGVENVGLSEGRQWGLSLEAGVRF